MPNTLAAKSCTPCRGGIPPLTIEEAQGYLPQAPDWQLLDDGGKIQRTYRFKNFREALGFVQRAGELAEAEGHHPPRSRCRRRRSKVCTRTTSSWRRSSTVCRRISAGQNSARDVRIMPSSPGG